MSINIELLVIGGGGAGGSSSPNSLMAGGGGGSGQAVYKPSFSVPTSAALNITIGQPGVHGGTMDGGTADGGYTLFDTGVANNYIIAGGGGGGGTVGEYGSGGVLHGVLGGGDSGYCGGGGAGGNYPNASPGGGGVAYGGYGYGGYGGYGCGGGGGGSSPQAGTTATATVAGVGGAALTGTVGGAPFQCGGGGGGGGSNGIAGGLGQSGGGNGGNPAANGLTGSGFGSGGGGAGADLGYGTIAGNGTVGAVQLHVPPGTTGTFNGVPVSFDGNGNYTFTTNGILILYSGSGGSGGGSGGNILPGQYKGPGCCCSVIILGPCPACDSCPSSYTFTITGFNSDHAVFNGITVQPLQTSGCNWWGAVAITISNLELYLTARIFCLGNLPFIMEVFVDLVDQTPPYTRQEGSSYYVKVPANGSGCPTLNTYTLPGGGTGDCETSLTVNLTTP